MREGEHASPLIPPFYRRGVPWKLQKMFQREGLDCVVPDSGHRSQIKLDDTQSTINGWCFVHEGL